MSRIVVLRAPDQQEVLGISKTRDARFNELLTKVFSRGVQFIGYLDSSINKETVFDEHGVAVGKLKPGDLVVREEDFKRDLETGALKKV